MPGYNWMKKYVMPRNPRLSEIVFPGSHDAGVYDHATTNAGKLGITQTAVCQSGDLYEQLLAGSRLFDLRARLVREVNRLGDGNNPFAQNPIDKDGNVIQGSTLDKGRVRFYHGKNVVGTKGGGVAEQLRKVSLFLKRYPSEFCILRFAKTNCPNAVTNLVWEILGDVLYRKTGNLAKHKVNDMSGRAVALFDTTFHYHNQRTGIHRYMKKEAIDDGLGIAGSYAGSPFAKIVVNNQKKKLKKYVKKNLSGDRLYAWYQTQTYLLNIRTQTRWGVGSKSRSKELKRNLRDDAIFGAVNVVMLDFVDNYKCRKVYRRNDPVNGRSYEAEMS